MIFRNFFFLTENMSCLMVASVGPVGRQWAGSDASLDAWTPGSSWVESWPRHPQGVNSSGSPGPEHENSGFLVCVCVYVACGMHGQQAQLFRSYKVPAAMNFMMVYKEGVTERFEHCSMSLQVSERDSIYLLTVMIPTIPEIQ